MLYLTFLTSEFIDTVLVTFVDIAFVIFVDAVSVAFIILSHTITEVLEILFRCSPFWQIHVL